MPQTARPWEIDDVWSHADRQSPSERLPGPSPPRAPSGIKLGARRVYVGQTGNEGFVVLADPEGNEFCVLDHETRDS
jgi:hypothetical protein